MAKSSWNGPVGGSSSWPIDNELDLVDHWLCGIELKANQRPEWDLNSLNIFLLAFQHNFHLVLVELTFTMLISTASWRLGIWLKNQ
jgi:hypothetical protein